MSTGGPAQLEARLLSALSPDRALAHTRWLTEHTPYRISGGGQDRTAALYVRDRLAEAGLSAELQEFYTYCSFPEAASLHVVEPALGEMACQPCCHIAPTPEDGITAELVDAGGGSEEELARAEVSGRIVLCEVSYAPAPPEKARLAVHAGARGMVLMNWGLPDQTEIPMRALKMVWGNPTPVTFGEIPQISAVSVSRADGERLRRLCARGRTVVQMKAASTREWRPVVQPVGRLEGTRWPRQFLLASGHLDAWEPGVTCNATGNGLMLELARVFGAFREHLGRSLVFAFWNGHEVAEAAGSTWFVDRMWDEVSQNCVAYLNIDSPGLRGVEHHAAASTLELADFHQAVERDVLGSAGPRQPLGRIGDQSFFGVGVPALAGRSPFPASELKRTHGAVFGWWNHTAADTLDKVDEAAFSRELRVYAAYIFRLLTSPVLPFSFVGYARHLREALAGYAAGSPAELNLEPLAALAGELERKAASLEALRRSLDGEVANSGAGPGEERVDEVNRCLMRLSRVLGHATYTVAGRYGQDSYGLSVLSRPIPGLAAAPAMASMKRGTDAAETLLTDLLRQRNRIADALRDAVEAADRCLRAAQRGTA
ncbi:MAG: M28 family peptidase [Acetobacteraceae bacterium]|nr:M28 family peptidase [Acetobacteraceae bacterium]